MRVDKTRVQSPAQYSLVSLLVAAVILSFPACSHLAVGTLSPIVSSARNAALASPDVETFTLAVPSQIFLVEGALARDPDNRELRLTASMLYFAYAFAKVEDENERYASYLYRKGKEHGQAVLTAAHARLRGSWEGPLDRFLAALADLKKRDVPATTWTAANWAQFINLHLDSTAVLVQIPKVVALLERTCSLDGAYMNGLPYIILGSIHAFRPPLLGGKPQESQRNFRLAMEVARGQFLLAYYFRARYYCYRMQDRDCFKQSLAKVMRTPAEILPRYRLLNSIAKKKSQQLLEEEDELF